MNKRKLRNLEIKSVKEKEKDLIKNIEADIIYFVSAEKIKVDNENILSLCFFKKQDNKLNISYRVFINKKLQEYITQDFISVSIGEKTKWRTASLENLIGYYWFKHCLLINKTSVSAILKYFKIAEGPLKAINLFQIKIRTKKTEEKNKEITKEIDEEMNLIPKLPKDFSKWVDEVVMLKSRYIYYKYKRTNKPIQGYCTHCKKDVLINKPRHNTEGICPNCKSKIIYKAEGKSKYINDSGVCTIIQKVKTGGGLVIRYFEIQKYYSDYKNPILSISELLRDIYDEYGIGVKEFEFRSFKNMGFRWCKGIRAGLFAKHYEFENISLYTKNLTRALKDTPWQYSQIKEFATQSIGYKFNIYSYINIYRRMPFIEYLIKLNLTKLVEDIINSPTYILKGVFNLNGKNFIEILKLNKQALPRLKMLNVSLNQLKVLQEAYERNVPITDPQLNFIIKKIGYLSKDILDITHYTTLNKAIKYIKKQTLIALNADESTILRDWVDYIKSCKILKYNLNSDFVLFPKNLKQSHDENSKLIKENKIRLYNNLISERFQELFKLYKWEYKNYIIIPAKNADEMIKEGQSLHHCVGKLYLKSMALGESDIVFLRDKSKPEKSLVTIEIKNFNIIQARGKSNYSPSPEIQRIIEKFKVEKLKTEMGKIA